jgi:hypothetical protein
MENEMKKHIDNFKKYLTENKKLDLSDASRSFTIEDLEKAFNAEKVKYSYYRGDEKGLINNVTFEEWYKENYD